MFGAIFGDVVGSVYEFNNVKTKNFKLLTEGSYFTDDTVMTVALADALVVVERALSVECDIYIDIVALRCAVPLTNNERCEVYGLSRLLRAAKQGECA